MRLRFDLFEDLQVVAVVDHVEDYRDNGITVVATGENHASHVTLTIEGGTLFASLALPGLGDVEVEPYSSNTLLVSQYSSRRAVTCRASGRTIARPPALPPPTNDQPTQIDVGVLYTTAVKDNEATLQQKLDTWATHSSKYLTCSGVNARVNVVKLMKLDFNETGKLTDDLAALNSPATPHGQKVLQFRKDNQADVVLVLVAVGDGSGIANIFDSETPGEFRDVATAVVVRGAAFGHVLLHELGHTMGGGHQPPGHGRFSYSHGNVIDDKPHDHVTIMATGSGNRLPLFAGPNVQFGNGATGSKSRDIVRTLNETRAAIEGLQQSMRPPTPAVPCSTNLYPRLTKRR